MKSAPFEYARAASLAEACDLLARYGGDSKVLAGGQSLVPMMAMRLVRPAFLVDINEIDELKFVVIETDFCRIGACTRQMTIERNDWLGARVPLLRQALAWVGHAQTRNRGTVGGSLAHADPSAELPLAARVLGAKMTLRSSKGARTLDAEQFFTGPMSTLVRPDECLEEIHWPVWNGNRTGSAFTEIAIRHGDFAMVAAAAQVALDSSDRCTRAAFGLGGASGTPLAFPEIAVRLVGTKLEDKAIDAAADDAAAETDPGSDLHATKEYRRHLARVLAARALREARDRAVRQ
ncbi:MAG TPA: xanthine dehydrogenase family protein subunit M [Burkholderiales bacterium]|nr:xanthine dehydrogenase family protein subunit M [Burkholderiales bacterium]